MPHPHRLCFAAAFVLLVGCFEDTPSGSGSGDASTSDPGTTSSTDSVDEGSESGTADTGPGCAMGDEDCACFDDQTCNAGLVCTNDVCTNPCGNGRADPGEQCDDGNQQNSDGCNVNCIVSGSLIWEIVVEDENQREEWCSELAILENEDIAVAGMRRDAEGLGQVWIGRYTSSGDAVWTQFPPEDYGAYYGVTGLPDGDIIAVGHTSDLPRITRFHGDGEIVWSQYIVEEATTGSGLSVVYTDAGELFIGGSVNTDTWTSLHQDDGTMVWSDAIAGSDGLPDHARRVAASSDSLVAAGHLEQGGNVTWTRKYSLSGDVLWTREHDGPIGHDRARSVGIDSQGNVITVGFETVEDEGRNAWIRKYDPDGNELWTRIYNGAASGDDQAEDIDAGTNDEIIVGGFLARQAGPGNQPWLRRYSATGDELWTTQLDSLGSVFSVEIGPSGNIFACGTHAIVGDDLSARDIWIAKFAP